MQIAAMNPVAMDPESVPADVVAREKSYHHGADPA